jgi:7-cyano-7-deazaguanine synthase in queuosine biosynthesis
VIEPRLIICGETKLGAKDKRRKGRVAIELSTHGRNQNVNLQIEDVAKVLLHDLSSRLLDLLEIASYVYAADCSTSRGKGWSAGAAIESWPRDFRFVIPVRDVQFWRDPEVGELLISCLSFISNDDFAFDFVRLKDKHPVQQYLSFAQLNEWPFDRVNRVLLFSGGLDSLAGAIKTLESGENTVLVSHRSVAAIDKRQRELVAQLKQKYRGKLLHIPVWVNKDSSLSREYTQRTRSFLYSALGVVVGESIGSQGIRFFENGVVSMNLPIADEVLRARASRTTHPFALDLLRQFYQKIMGRPIHVDNPFFLMTKTEVVRSIMEQGCGDLIAMTCSCSHTWFQPKNQWHCGGCSQCIDRRIAVIAAGAKNYDPENDYVNDVFRDERKEGYDRNIAIDYARHAFEMNRMTDREFAASFNLEISRAIRVLPDRTKISERIIEMHKRHASAVMRVLESKIRESSKELLAGSLAPSSMLSLIVGQKHLQPIWKNFAERILSLLQIGIPTTCKRHKPENEPHLQELCDGILKAQNIDLVREFPFLRWSSVMTKPDWSNEQLELFVELKYVRQKSDIRQISRDIAEDITKYGDGNRRVQFIVYDPYHLIVDEKEFASPVMARSNMTIGFVR